MALTTIRSQIRSVLQKLDVRSQLAAASLASEHRELLPEREQRGRDRRRTFDAERRAVTGLQVDIA